MFSCLSQLSLYQRVTDFKDFHSIDPSQSIVLHVYGKKPHIKLLCYTPETNIRL